MNNITSIRPINKDDFAFYLKLKSEKQNIFWGGFIKKPNRHTLYDYFFRIIQKENNREMYIICHCGKPVGELHFSIMNHVCLYEGLAVASNYSGKGIATMAVKMFIDIIKNNPDISEIRFFIRADNLKSSHIHEKLGFQRTGSTESHYIESEMRNVIMEEWVMVLK